ncbi:MAG: hypothetical protein QOE70_5046 [Chthoniobacter sp.]|jgi:hypothetical protein|nr:hypothetical protein [Chthoniobacter sp.]
MKLTWLALLAAAAPLLGAEKTAPSPPAKKGSSFDDFHLVRTRNIFDPNRRSTRTDAPPPRASTSPVQTRPNFLALTGTMVSEGRTLAFFSGSRTDYSKIISVGESVADFKVIRITPIQVELQRGDKASVLAVGNQIALEGSSPVPVSTTTSAAPPEGAPAAPDAPAGATAASAPPPTNDKTEILRRLMERRQKEISK